MSHFSLSRNAATAERNRARMRFLGHTPNGHPLWDGTETSDLVEGHPDYDAVMQKMWRRTRVAARGKAGRLKITKPRAPAWDDNELLGYENTTRPTRVKRYRPPFPVARMRRLRGRQTLEASTGRQRPISRPEIEFWTRYWLVREP